VISAAAVTSIVVAAAIATVTAMAVMATATAAVAAMATAMAAMETTIAAVAAMAKAIVAMGTATAAVVAMATAMAATMAATMTAVAGTKTTAATAMGGGTDNNQLKGAAEETTSAVTVTAVETATATETVTVTARIRTATPMLKGFSVGCNHNNIAAQQSTHFLVEWCISFMLDVCELKGLKDEERVASFPSLSRLLMHHASYPSIYMCLIAPVRTPDTPHHKQAAPSSHS
jgi:hypothetical protein